MNLEQLERKLGRTEEIEITVTDRESGKPVTHPVWFVLEDHRLHLVPVHGSDSKWFNGVLADPRIHVAAGGAERTLPARPVRDPARVRDVVEKFRAKYGADQVKKYYSKFDVAVEVPLQAERER